MKIGIYGGSFDPPHMAHVLVVAWALATAEVDAVWVVPTGGHPFGKDLSPFADRLEMCRRAFGCFGDRAQILEIEAEPRTHYSIDTLRALASQFPEHTWRWIMGSDTLADAPKWREFDALIALAPPLTIPRRDHGDRHALGATAGFALPDLSSTLVRRLIAAGQNPADDGLIPRHVMDWIAQRGLYGLRIKSFSP